MKIKLLFSLMVLGILTNLGLSGQTEHLLNATDFDIEGSNYYVDQDKWLAIDPSKGHRNASAKTTVPAGNARFTVELHTVGENDGSSNYEVLIGGRSVGIFTAPVSQQTTETGPRYTAVWGGVNINEGEIIEVKSRVHYTTPTTSTRGRWAKVVLSTREVDPGRAQTVAASKQTFEQTGPDLVQPRGKDGDGKVTISGELKTWHNVMLTQRGPWVHERDNKPNPFIDYSMYVTFAHESGVPVYTVPGYFAGDGMAAETSAEAGYHWRAHLSPDKAGTWSYRVSFVKGDNAALDPSVDSYLKPYHGAHGYFDIEETDKEGIDFRAKGRLEYVGGHYLRFAGSGDFYLKAGPDAPETILAYTDFDDTVALKSKVPLKTWAPHAQDYEKGDPTWQNGKGKNIIGAMNYLSSKGVNAFSFLTYNAGGDGDNIWPFVERDTKFHYDVSKLDQWGIVFSHAQAKGIYLHFKLQENELDDNRRGSKKDAVIIPESLDGGAMGPERKLYLRELIARYSHNLALNWNLGEENTQSYEEQNAMSEYILNMDPYDHNIVIHSFPSQQEQVYRSLIGHKSVLTGTSLQNPWHKVHQQTLRWVEASKAAGKPWVVANDEQNPANQGVPPDPGYNGFDGWGTDDRFGKYNVHHIRKYTLWGNLMAGGAGVEYYFGYQLPQNDLLAEDFRSRDLSWTYCGYAINFFYDNDIPFWRMRNRNELVGNSANENTRFCLGREDEVYVVYLLEGGTTDIDLREAQGKYSVKWFNPREGGKLLNESVKSVTAGKKVSLGKPPSHTDEDWVVLVTK